ncbi:MAG: outer membrane protein assembly factor BamB [Enterobacter hormaechei]|nr:outer membrane protein assembly factor BamB [Enterobacter hormaechei]
MQLRKLLLPGLLSVTLLSGCSLFSGEEDVVKMSPLPTVENQFTPSTAWDTSVGDGIGDFYSNLHPAFADGVVYAADRKGTVKALNADDGKEVWSINLAEKDGWFSRKPALLSGGLTVAGGHVYVGSEKAQVYALNASDGSVAWQTTVAGESLSRPVVSDGLVLIHTSNGQLQALNEADGLVKWTVNLDMPALSLRGESAPATAFGAAIVGGDNGRVSAVLMQQGQMIWQQRISQATGSTEMLGSVNDFIVDGNRIYMVDQNDRLLALSTEGGVTLWTQSDLLHRLLTAPALYNGSLVVGDSEGYMHWIDPENGRFVAQQKVDSSGFLTEPVVADGKLLIQAKDGTLYAITR